MAVSLNEGMVSREVAFCRVYSQEAKEELERVFLKNRISYFIEWQERSFLSKLFGAKDRNVFTIKINEEDIPKATELANNIDSVKLKKNQ